MLHELLEHHIEEEESDIFAVLGDNFDRDELEAMGAQFKRLKAEVLRAPAARTETRRAATPLKRRVTGERRATRRQPHIAAVAQIGIENREAEPLRT